MEEGQRLLRSLKRQHRETLKRVKKIELAVAGLPEEAEHSHQGIARWFLTLIGRRSPVKEETMKDAG